MDGIRTPPQAIDAEQAVLGGLLLENDALDDFNVQLSPNDFYHHNHRLIYQHIEQLITQEQPADVITVAEALENSGKLETVGGIAYLGTLVHGTTNANLRRYAEIVHERAVMRHLIALCSSLSEKAYNPQGTQTADLLDEAAKKIIALAETGRKDTQSFMRMEGLLVEVTEKIDELFSREDQSVVTGVSTRFKDLDEQTSGLHE